MHAMPLDAFAGPGVVDLVRRFAAGEHDPVRAAEDCFARIATLDPVLGAFVALDRDEAMRAAKRSRARWAGGAPRSAIDGVPFGVKANVAVAGLAWHAGIAAYRDRVAPCDAACVAQLRAAGAVVLGVLNMDEGALGALGENAWLGRCNNPHRAGFTPGGSSSGAAAAVAAGLCAAALATDTLGSVRIPASYCGVYGFKPARTAISREGVTPLSPTLDAVGVLARSAADLAAVMTIFSTTAPSGAFGELAAMRIAKLELAEGVMLPEVREAFERTVDDAARQGAAVDTLVLRDWNIAAIRRAALLVCEADASAEHAAALTTRPSGFSPNLGALLAFGASAAPSKITDARRRLAQAGAQLREVFGRYDAVLSPATPQTAFSFDEATPVDQADFTITANLADLTALAFPVGTTRSGLPLAVQAIAGNADAALTLATRLGAPAHCPLAHSPPS